MIRNIHIRNFRCFSDLKIDDCRRINVIVGDNGAGKTSLLEGLFFALGSSSELGIRFRQQRGLDGSFSGGTRKIEEAIWRDLFHKSDWAKTIAIELTGDGPEARSLQIFRGTSQLSIPFAEGDEKGEQVSGSITAQWRDSAGNDHATHPVVSKKGVEFEGTGEDIPDFYYFAAGFTPSSNENAGRFSDLSRLGKSMDFIKIFTNEYDWIESLSIEVLAGAPVIYATLKGGEKMPLPLVSGGINRIVGIMLAIAARSNSVVLVDEMEDGIYHKHHEALWRALLKMSRDYQTQLFLTTHSDEWINALVRAAGDNMKDIALWRIERSESGQPEVLQFDGETLSAGLEQGAEVRGGAI
jgi:ABC-type transport system involved in cytochrome c biogenesis ATPase subunit